MAVFSVPSVAFGDFDLLGVRGLDPRPVALLEPSAHPDAAVLELFRFHSGCGKGALMALQDRDCESLRPSPPEIHVNRASAFADRRHLAFHHGEMAALGQKLGRALGAENDIIRFAPQAKLGLARGPPLRQQLVGAGPVPNMGGNPRKSPAQHLMRRRASRALPRDVHECEHSAVAIGGRDGLTKLDRLIGKNRCERRSRRSAGIYAALARPGREGDLDGGQANFAPIVERKAAAVDDRTDLARSGGLEAASARRGAFRARVRRRQGHHAGHAAYPTPACKSDVPTPAHAVTKRSEWGGTAAMWAFRPAFSPRIALISVPPRATRRSIRTGR